MRLLLSLVIALCFCLPAFSYDENPRMDKFVQRMKDRYDADVPRLKYILKRVKHVPEVIELMDRQAEKSEWERYKQFFVTPSKIKKGVIYYKKHWRTLQAAERKYGVKAEVIAAILGVETDYGKHPLPYLAVDALATLAFDYPRRSAYFMDQLEELFLYCTKNRISIFTIKGSYAGAVGIPQFMPGNIMKYGVDFDRNGKIDILRSHKDAIGSVARYLQKHGWKKGQYVAAEIANEPENVKYKPGKQYRASSLRKKGIDLPSWVRSKDKLKIVDFDKDELWGVYHNFDVIKKYNKSNKYAMAVTLLASKIKSGLRR